MIPKASIEDFLDQKKIVVVGASRNRKKFGNAIFRELKSKGYQVFPVNPNATTIDNVPCYPSIKEVPEAADAVVLIVPPSVTEQVVLEVIQANIRRVWMQPGCESIRAVKLCRERGINVVYGECLLMFLEPAALIHRMHRCVKRLLGRLPR